MKREIMLGSLLFVTLTSIAQPNGTDPVHFSYRVLNTGDKKYEVHITAAMDDSWHIYSQVQPTEAVSEPTKISFNKNPLLVITGKPTESGEKEKYEDKASGIIQYQYGGKVEFVQTITPKAAVKTMLTGTIRYQACSGDRCLPPKTIPFQLSL